MSEKRTTEILRSQEPSVLWNSFRPKNAMYLSVDSTLAHPYPLSRTFTPRYAIRPTQPFHRLLLSQQFPRTVRIKPHQISGFLRIITFKAESGGGLGAHPPSTPTRHLCFANVKQKQNFTIFYYWAPHIFEPTAVSDFCLQCYIIHFRVNAFVLHSLVTGFYLPHSFSNYIPT